jgi:hypothetical protein
MAFLNELSQKNNDIQWHFRRLPFAIDEKQHDNKILQRNSTMARVLQKNYQSVFNL